MILVALISVSGFVTYTFLTQSTSSQAVGFKAAIVDELSATFPNASFNDNAKAILIGAGYTVDYYRPDQVTVDFFKSLPSKGYGVVIIRAHTTDVSGQGYQTKIVTSEHYSTYSHDYEQLTGLVGRARLEDGQEFFSIPPKFVRDAMQGQFHDSTIIMMGCTGLITSEMAQAFVARGARVYLAWIGTVAPDRTDAATITLLKSITQGNTVGQAVNKAMTRVGPDPTFDSHLGYYPENQATLVLGALHNSTRANTHVSSLVLAA